jgi:hypothetical protein
MAVSKLIALLYKLEMDGWDWEILIKELEAKSERRISVPIRVRESVYKEFTRACGDATIADVVELLMVHFIRFKRSSSNKKKT